MSAIDIRHSSLGVTKFKSQKSMQTRILPFFLITRTTFKIQSAYLIVRMNFALNSLSISSLILITTSGANLQGVCFIDFWPSFIGSLCSTNVY